MEPSHSSGKIILQDISSDKRHPGVLFTKMLLSDTKAVNLIYLNAKILFWFYCQTMENI